MNTRRKTPAETWARMEPHIYFDTTESGCWIWLGNLSKKGYGRVQCALPPDRFSGSKPAHRVSWWFHRGPIPTGLVLDHLCRVRSCVNPHHLEPVTNEVNLLRGNGACAVNSRKSSCKRGHQFTPESTYVWTGPKGKPCRQCRTCAREYHRARRLHRRQA